MLAKTEMRQPGRALMGTGTAVCATGVAILFYSGIFGNATLPLIALLFIVVVIGLCMIEQRTLMLSILVIRASGDILLEATRPGLSVETVGLGAVINVIVIVLSISMVLEHRNEVPRAAWVLWAGFFLTATYSIALSPVKGEAIRFYGSWLSNLAMFVSAFYIVRSKDDFRLCIRLILWSSVVPAAVALVEIVTGANGSASAVRVQGTFSHPNIFAFYLSVVVPLGFYLLKSRQGTRAVIQQLGLGCYLLFLTGLLLLTQTRSAWIAMVVLVAMYGFCFERRYLIYLGLLIGLALLIPAVQDRLVDLATGSDESHQARLNSFAWRMALWEAALDWMAPSHYLFGYGVGAFRENSVVFFPAGGKVRWDAHNVYIQWLFDAGVVGVAAYLWVHLRMVALLRAFAGIDRLAAFIIFALVANYLIVSLSDNMMFYLSFNWYYFFLLGTGIALARISVPKKRRIDELNRQTRWLPTSAFPITAN